MLACMDATPIVNSDVAAGRGRVPWAAVVVFIVIAFGLSWLVEIPTWLSGGVTSPMFGLTTLGMMYTPTIAALVVVFLMVKPARKARYLGLVPFRPVWRKILLFVLAPILFLALGFAAFGIALALGWTDADWALEGFSTIVPEGISTDMYLMSMYVQLPITLIIASASAFGEELGWRGFLTTALSPLGFWPSALIIGVVWGLWHAPIILMGYNFQRTDVTGVLWMCGFTLFVGVLLQWARYWTRNVWPAVVGHGALNATSTFSLIWLTDTADTAMSTILGVPGWIVMGVVILLLVVTGLIGRRMPRPLVPEPAPTARLDPDAPVEVRSYGQARSSVPSAPRDDGQRTV